MATIPFAVAELVRDNGFELFTLDDFRATLDDVQAEFQKELAVEHAAQVVQARQRLALLVRLMPTARFVLWKRQDEFITLSPTLESLQSEFPWLNNREKVAK